MSPFDLAFACLVLTRAIADGDGAWRRAAKAAGRRLCDLNRMKKSLSARCFLGERLSILCNRHFAPATAQLDRSARSAVRYRSQLSHHAAGNSADFTLRLSSGRFHDASTNEILGQNPNSKKPSKTKRFQGLDVWLRGRATISNCYSKQRLEQPLDNGWQTVFSLEVLKFRNLYNGYFFDILQPSRRLRLLQNFALSERGRAADGRTRCVSWGKPTTSSLHLRVP